MDLLSYNPQVLFGAAGFIGAALRGGIAFYQIKKAQPKTTFDKSIFMDTAIEGIGTGIAFAVGLPITYAALGVTALASAGVDTMANKFGIKIVPVLRDLVIKKGTKTTATKK